MILSFLDEQHLSDLLPRSPPAARRRPGLPVQFLFRLSYFSKDFKGEFSSQSNHIQGHLRTEKGKLDKHV